MGGYACTQGICDSQIPHTSQPYLTVSAASADITYDLHFQLKDQSHMIFLCLFVYLNVVARLVLLSTEFT